MLTGVLSARRDMPSDGEQVVVVFLVLTSFSEVLFQILKAQSRQIITYFGHDDRGGHTPPFSSVSQLGGVASGGEKLSISEAQ